MPCLQPLQYIRKQIKNTVLYARNQQDGCLPGLLNTQHQMETFVFEGM